MDHDQPVRDAIGRVEVVRHHHLCEAFLLLKPADQLGDQVGVDRIQSRRRFIIEDHLRPAGQGARDRDPLFHAAAEFGRHLLERVFEPDETQRLDDLPFDDVVRKDLLLVEAIAHVPADGERVEQRGSLEDHRHAGTDRNHVPFGKPDDFLPVDADGPGVRAEQAQDQTQHGRLAAAAAPQDRHRVSGRNLQAEILEDRPAVKHLAHVGESDHGRLNRERRTPWS